MPRAEFAFNSSVNRKIGRTPFEIVYGQIPRRPLDLAPIDPHTRISEDGISFAQHIRNMHHDIQHRIASQNEWYKAAANVGRRSVSFREDELVMVKLRSEKYSPGVATKLHAHSAGPFPVARVISENAYVVIFTFNVSDLARYRPLLEIGMPHTPPDLRSKVNERPLSAPLVLSPPRHEYVESVLSELINVAGDKVDRRLLVHW